VLSSIVNLTITENILNKSIFKTSMVFFTFIEIINLVILALAVGYIFSGYIRDPSHKMILKPKFNWKDFRFALIVSAPGIVFHELGHKFVALVFGLGAVFKVWFPGLGIAVFLKLIHSPFLIIAPGYVLISGDASPIQSILIAVAGPLINLVLWVVATLILSRARSLSRRQATFLYLTKRINMLLFVFNMLPIPPLDGSRVLLGLIQSIS